MAAKHGWGGMPAWISRAQRRFSKARARRGGDGSVASSGGRATQGPPDEPGGRWELSWRLLSRTGAQRGGGCGRYGPSADEEGNAGGRGSFAELARRGEMGGRLSVSVSVQQRSGRVGGSGRSMGPLLPCSSPPQLCSTCPCPCPDPVRPRTPHVRPPREHGPFSPQAARAFWRGHAALRPSPARFSRTTLVYLP